MMLRFLLLSCFLLGAFAPPPPPDQHTGWTRKTPQGPYYPKGRYYHTGGLTTPGNFVVFGGNTGSSLLRDVFTYNEENNTVTMLWEHSDDDDDHPAPSAREGSCAGFLPEVVVGHTRFRNNTLFIFGGRNGTHYLNDMWAFDLNINNWTQVVEHSDDNGVPAGRAFHTCVMQGGLGDELFGVFGGKNGDDNYYGTNKNDFVFFNFSKALWEIPPYFSGAKPSARAYMTGVAVTPDQIMVYGGYNGTCLGDTWMYDRHNFHWNLVADHMDPMHMDYPQPTCSYAAAHDGNKFQLFGGFVGCNDTVTWETWEDDPMGHWSRNDFLNCEVPPARAGALGALDGPNFVIYGGFEGQFLTSNPTTVYGDLWYWSEGMPMPPMP